MDTFGSVGCAVAELIAAAKKTVLGFTVGVPYRHDFLKGWLNRTKDKDITNSVEIID
jgi:hypothetical protein